MGSLKLAVSPGDYNGIGPEIIIKAFAEESLRDLGEFSYWGCAEIFENCFETFSADQQNTHRNSLDFILNNLRLPENIDNIDPVVYSPGKMSRESGKMAYICLEQAIESWKRGETDAIVTAPVSKHTFFPENLPFNGQTEWIAHKAGSGTPLMVMIAGNLRFALVTTHIRIREIPDAVTTDLIVQKGTVLFNSLKRDFGIETPRIAVCALNPHAGEEGRFGNAESTVISPAIDTLKNNCRGEWAGPVPADTLFVRSKVETFDAVLAMYHDQGLIPAKIYSGMHGVNFTAGLPVVRTSPDHGTAFDIAGCRARLRESSA